MWSILEFSNEPSCYLRKLAHLRICRVLVSLERRSISLCTHASFKNAPSVTISDIYTFRGITEFILAARLHIFVWTASCPGMQCDQVCKLWLLQIGLIYGRGIKRSQAGTSHSSQDFCRDGNTCGMSQSSLPTICLLCFRSMSLLTGRTTSSLAPVIVARMAVSVLKCLLIWLVHTWGLQLAVIQYCPYL